MRCARLDSACRKAVVTFYVLAEAGVIEPDFASELQRMVGFRSVAVHRYQDLDMAILHAVVNEKLGVFEAFAAAMVQCRNE